MKKHLFLLVPILVLIAARCDAGTLFYVPISSSGSDDKSGISTDNGYTTAVDGGNSRGTDRIVNGITLYALSGNGQSATADNCTINALSGTLANGTGATRNVQADGT